MVNHIIRSRVGLIYKSQQYLGHASQVLLSFCLPADFAGELSFHQTRTLNMEKAVDAARQGSLAYFESLEADEFARLCNRKDEDGRYLLHTAAVGGNLQLVQLIMNAGSSEYVSCVDDEVSCAGCTHTSISKGHADTFLHSDSPLSHFALLIPRHTANVPTLCQ